MQNDDIIEGEFTDDTATMEDGTLEHGAEAAPGDLVLVAGRHDYTLGDDEDPGHIFLQGERAEVFEGVWYRCVADTPVFRGGKDRHYSADSKPDVTFNVGDLAHVIKSHPRRIFFVHYESQFFTDPETFLAGFQLAPDGDIERSKELMGYVEKLGLLQNQAADETDKVAGFKPYIGTDQQLSGTEAIASLEAPVTEMESEPELDSSSTFLVDGRVAIKRDSANASLVQQSKKAAMTMRNEIVKITNQMSEVNSGIQRLTTERSLIISGVVDNLQDYVGSAMEAVHSINLYLGKDENILLIRDGKKAAAETPISIRTQILFMDEECALKAAGNNSGIDYADVNKGVFDDWLTSDPEHLQQVLPEEKGIVILRPRRYPKDYGNPWETAAKAELNKQTYFLLRNGECLYCLWTAFDAGYALLPAMDEFKSYFNSGQFDNLGAAIIHEPGSYEFMEAMKRADEKRRHYMRVGLILQGILDRTPVFRPLPHPVNVTDPHSYGGFLRVIDGNRMVLDDGHERFNAWMKRVNNQIDIGSRVVLIPSYFKDEIECKDEPETHRLSPRKTWRGYEGRMFSEALAYPKEDVIYTISKRVGKGFAAVYTYQHKMTKKAKKGDPYPGQPGYVYRYSGAIIHEWEETRNAQIIFYHDDSFILNIDAVTTEELRYFLASRLDRKNYATMFPLLERALELKLADEATEEPFRQLVAGQIMARYGVHYEEAVGAITELFDWYKKRHREHAALHLDHKTALAQIIDQYGRTHAKTGALSLDDKIVLELRKLEPEALLIGKKPNGDYVVLSPEHGADKEAHIYVRESSYKRKTGLIDVVMAEVLPQRKSWTGVDNRHTKWDVLYTSELWLRWKIGAKLDNVLTGPELEQVIEQAIEATQKYILGGKEPIPAVPNHGHPDANKQRPVVCEPLYVTVTKDAIVQCYFVHHWENFPEITRLAQDASQLHKPTVSCVVIGWTRGKNGTITTSIGHDGWRSRCSPVDKLFGGWFVPDGRIAIYNEGNIAKLKESCKRYAAIKEVEQRRQHDSRGAYQSMHKQYYEYTKNVYYQEFLAEYGDPELWEATLKLEEQNPKTKIKKAVPDAIMQHLDILFDYLVDNGVSIHGQKVLTLVSHELVAKSDPPLGYETHARGGFPDYKVTSTFHPFSVTDPIILGFTVDIDPNGQAKANEAQFAKKRAEQENYEEAAKAPKSARGFMLGDSDD